MPGGLLPEDDLYARLEVDVDASPEAIEVAWRALLKRHHPDVAGSDDAALDRAKRINVAHDWLSDPALRARYDADRLGLAPVTHTRRGSARRPGFRPRGARATATAAARARRSSTRVDLVRGEPAERLARFLARVEHLTPDELDRLAAAEPPPIAFLATVRRFLGPEPKAAFADAEAELVRRVPPDRWAQVGLREGQLGVAAELVLAPFLDDLLAELVPAPHPHPPPAGRRRGRARDRLLRAWDASLDQPRFGPNGAGVIAVRDRVATLTHDELVAFVRASQGIDGADRPWPDALDRDEDEALRISALLAERDVAAAVPVAGLAPAAATRVRRLAARLGHVTALRHAFPAPVYAGLVAPFAAATGSTHSSRADGPDVRRAR